jgi:membrane protein implicated in regulation of membrane protease activity
MADYFFAYPAAWYSVPALVGTVFFALRIVLMLAGMGDHAFDLNHDLDVDHPDSGHSFEILSIQSIAAFAMGFGWGAFAGLKSGFSPLAVNLVGLAAGSAMVWLLAVALRGMADLQTSGNIPLASAVGKEGDVYVTVPGATGRGQVRLTLDARQRFYDAVADETLPTGTRVRVLKVNDDQTLMVAKA